MDKCLVSPGLHVFQIFCLLILKLEEKKIPYGDKVGDQQQVELRREKNYLSHKELLRKTQFSKIARSIYKNQLHFYILAMNNLN